MKIESIFDNGFFEFVKAEQEFEINGEKKLIKRNMVRRPPGIRAIIVKKQEKKVLLSREFRFELNKWDYRLPGGKVFDSLKDYQVALKDDTVLMNVEKTVAKEVMEEVGIQVNKQLLFKISPDGSGVVWDLFYYEITDFEIIKNGQHLEEDEMVEGFVWKTFDEVKKMCIEGDINEDRTVGVLLTYILKCEMV